MTCAVLARAILGRDGLDALRVAVPEADLVVVRLSASLSTIERRLRQRDSGEELEEHLRESVEMSRVMDREGLENFTVANDEGSPGDAAKEVLQRAGWLG